ncbi:hypothetical protein [Frankia sp. AgB32]|uniref:hypothetical protein n=1 Tax=Frankia sp. AgB32 TaxID=631119 RepID=UPI00200EDF83|nr:hypothetical protein [Frankia sp. AgB32]MCK9893643.1 hypothetical protein [Frankia sp. AgB32]
MRVSFFIWHVRLTLIRVVFIGLAGYLLRVASDAGQGSAVGFLVTGVTIGLLLGGILTCFEQGFLGTLAETFVDLICFGAGMAAARLAHEYGKPCVPDHVSVWTFAAFAFPFGFLLARSMFGRGLDAKVARVRSDLSTHPTVGRFLGPVVGPPSGRGGSPLRHLSLVERAVGVALGLPPYVLTVYLLFSVLGGQWLVHTSTVLSPLAGMLGSSEDASRLVRGLAEAVETTVHSDCLRGMGPPAHH